MKKISLFTLVLIPYVLFSQAESVWNPSHFVFLRHPYGQCTVQAYAAIEESAVLDAVFALPLAGSEALCSRFSKLYVAGFNQLEVSASFAKHYAQRLSFALTASYVSLGFSDVYYGKKQGLDLSFASCFRLNTPCILSLQWKNPFAFSYFVNGEQRERIPSELQFSGMYRCSEQLLLYAVYTQNFHSSVHFSIGADVFPLNKLRLFTSLRFPDVQLSFGVGCEGKHCLYAARCAYSRFMGTCLGLVLGKAGIFTTEGFACDE